MRSIVGANLEHVERVNVVNDIVAKLLLDSSWVLQSFTSNIRYTVRDEINTLRSVQPVLNRPEADQPSTQT